MKNPNGSVRVEVRAVPQPLVQAFVQGRLTSNNDFTLKRDGGSFSIVTTPPDGARLDLKLTVPYRHAVRMETTDGDLSYDGLGRAELQTETGAVSLRFPEEVTSFELQAAHAPEEFEGDARLVRSGEGWTARDRLPEWRDVFGRIAMFPYGRVTLQANRPRAIKIELTETLPDDSPIQPHWRAMELLPDLFRFARKGLRRRDVPGEPDEETSEATFSADARLVQLEATATDRHGRPAADLTREDFEVLENGKVQQLVEDVSSAAAPFNLVLLLDCSSSTEQDRPAIEEAARRFISTARPGDKVAVYALAETYFQILSPLTEDHDTAKKSVEGIERFGGATPLYDAIVLAYAQELAARPQERNAMIVLSDGLDNEIYSHVGPTGYWKQPSVTGRRSGAGVPSFVTFEDLQRAVREMRALIYPVVLDPLRSVLQEDDQRLEDGQRWARTVRQRSAALAQDSGGTVFEAESARDLDEVYDRVARELRSVYTLAYRPSDQDFDGKWRRVRVRTNRKGIAVRTRPGYYAH
ncbi:MAG: VWA domain-containing protein [Bryobacterales bacterium]